MKDVGPFLAAALLITALWGVIMLAALAVAALSGQPL